MGEMIIKIRCKDTGNPPDCLEITVNYKGGLLGYDGTGSFYTDDDGCAECSAPDNSTVLADIYVGNDYIGEFSCYDGVSYSFDVNC